MPEDEQLAPPGPTCWRCDDAMVIDLRAGTRAPCPACFNRPDRRHLQRDVMWKCRPRATYRPTSG